MSNNKAGFGSQDIPEINKAVNIPSLNLTATEGFVLSQVDGRMTIGELKLISNLREKEFADVLDKLVKAGAVKIKESRVPAEKKPLVSKELKNGTASFEDRVRSLYLDMESLTHYDLLGIGKNATNEEIKKAFYRMTKEFHPDRFFRGGDVEVRERLQNIFARINDAYKTLLDPNKRREYDAGFEEIEDRLNMLVEDKRKNNPFMETILKSKRLYEGALEEIKRKNYAAAKQNLKIAISLDPFNKHYPETLLKIDKLESAEQARRYYSAALVHESEGRYKEAAKLYREAMVLDSENELYYIRLAKIILQQENNPEAAKKLVQKAIELNPGNPEQYLILGLIFREKGQREAAIAQFEKGLKIDPDHKELVKEFKRTKKGK